jgi:hypothetical protein
MRIPASVDLAVTAPTAFHSIDEAKSQPRPGQQAASTGLLSGRVAISLSRPGANPAWRPTRNSVMRRGPNRIRVCARMPRCVGAAPFHPGRYRWLSARRSPRRPPCRRDSAWRSPGRRHLGKSLGRKNGRPIKMDFLDKPPAGPIQFLIPTLVHRHETEAFLGQAKTS